MLKSNSEEIWFSYQ